MTGNIPAELRAHPAWLVWKRIQRGGGKPVKMPYYPNGNYRRGIQGSNNDRKGFGDFNTALKALGNKRQAYAGLGIAMLPDWGIVAVDFDNCVSVEGGHNIAAPEVFKLVAPTYWEYSPSGKGIRAFFKGHLRDAKSLGTIAEARGWGVEFFCSKGFVTVTGDIAPGMEMVEPDIVELTPEIKALYNECFGSRGSGSNSEQPVVNMTDEEIVRMLELWSPDVPYDEWLHIGMAIHHETHGEGLELWDTWSSTGAEYSRDECVYKWEGFGREDKEVVRTIRWMLQEKPIDFVLENVSNDFEPVPAKLDAKGKKIRAFPALKVSQNGDIDATVANVIAWISRPDLTKVEIGYDTFADEVMMKPYDEELGWRNVTDDDYTLFRQHLDQKKFKSVSKDMIRDCISLVAKENEFDSAKVWLTGLKWDGVSRVERFFSTYLGADDTEYTRAAGLYVWTAQAARILDPGCKADMVPVLVGPQGRGKSECVAAIAPDPDFFTELDFTHRDDDASRKLRGKLVAECAELSGLGGRAMDSVKAFITKTHERWIPKYKEKASTYARRFVIYGTSNAEDFLEDHTGNRRWIPIKVRGGKVVWVRRDRAQLWAEAAVLWGFVGIDVDKVRRLAEDVHENFINVDPWQDDVCAWLGRARPAGGTWGDSGLLTSSSLMEGAVGVVSAQQNNQTAKRLQRVMHALGYELKQVRDANQQKHRCWVKHVV